MAVVSCFISVFSFNGYLKDFLSLFGIEVNDAVDSLLADWAELRILIGSHAAVLCASVYAFETVACSTPEVLLMFRSCSMYWRNFRDTDIKYPCQGNSFRIAERSQHCSYGSHY